MDFGVMLNIERTGRGNAEMDQYTEMLRREAAALSPYDDDYEEHLRFIAGLFCSFAEAMTRFLMTHGYDGKPDDVQAKKALIRKRFIDSGIPVPRTLGRWFDPDFSIRRETAFQFCFAFSLSCEETDLFFQKVMFERSFDCHVIADAVFYFCMRNHLPYQKAEELIDLIGSIPEEAEKNHDEILYTGTIMDCISGISSEAELVSYFREHLCQFGYHHATARKNIRVLWDRIRSEQGLAYQENRLWKKCYDHVKDPDASDEDEYLTLEENDSVWKIYGEIFGLDKKQFASLNQQRSLAGVLHDNELIHSLARNVFPNQNSIERILNGIPVRDETVRKLLILLVFYSFWAETVIAHNDAAYQTTKEEADRCVDLINRYLIESGFAELYAGNPYDWIYLWANQNEEPLTAFRAYILELIAVKREQMNAS